jgi:hypothetical protein
MKGKSNHVDDAEFSSPLPAIIFSYKMGMERNIFYEEENGTTDTWCIVIKKGLRFISNRQLRKEGTFGASELAGIEPTPDRSGRAGYARLNLSATGGIVIDYLLSIAVGKSCFFKGTQLDDFHLC